MSIESLHSFYPLNQSFEVGNMNIPEALDLFSPTTEKIMKSTDKFFTDYGFGFEACPADPEQQRVLLNEEQLRELPSLFSPIFISKAASKAEKKPTTPKATEKATSIQANRKRKNPNASTARDGKIQRFRTDLSVSVKQPSQEQFRKLCAYIASKYPYFDLSLYETIESLQKSGHPLHFAIKEKDIDLLVALVKAGADVNQCDENGNTVLDVLMWQKELYTGFSAQDEGVIEYLIENGLRVTGSDHSFNSSNFKWIIEACGRDNFGLIEFLFSKKEIFVKKNTSAIAHTLIENKYLNESKIAELMDKLFSQGLRVDTPDKIGRTLLYKALNQLNKKIISLLLIKYKANPKLVRKSGKKMGAKNPLDLAFGKEIQLNELQKNVNKLLYEITKLEKHLISKGLNRAPDDEHLLDHFVLLTKEYEENHTSEDMEDNANDLLDLARRKKIQLENLQENVKDSLQKIQLITIFFRLALNSRGL